MQEQINPEEQKEQKEQQAQQSKKNKQKSSFQAKSQQQSSRHMDGDPKDPTIRAKHQPVKSNYTPIKAKHQPVKSNYTPIKAKHRPVKRSGGLPEKLAHNIEQMTGVGLDGIKVIKESSLPAQYNAEALAINGQEIHLKGGKEEHLAEEAAHIARQRKENLRPDTEMLKHSWAINTDSQVEQEDRAIGKQANNSGWMPDKGEELISTLPSSMIMQRHPAELDLIGGKNTDTPIKKAIGSLLMQYGAEMGPEAIDGLVRLVTQKLDAFLTSSLKDLISGEKLETVMEWAKEARKWYALVMNGKDVYRYFALPITILKYGLGRAITFLYRKIAGEDASLTWLTRLMQVDDAMLSLLDKLDDIVTSTGNLLAPLKYFDNDVEGNTAKTKNIMKLITSGLDLNPDSTFTIHQVRQLIGNKDDQAHADIYILPALQDKFQDEAVTVDKIKNVLQETEHPLGSKLNLTAHSGLINIWDSWLSHQVGAENKSIGEWLVSASSAKTQVATGAGALLVGAGGAIAMNLSPEIGYVVAGFGIVTLAGAKLYDYLSSSGDSKTPQNALKTPNTSSENKSEKSEANETNIPAKKPMQNIKTKFFWMNLHEVGIQEWEKTGGADIRFGMGFNFFGIDALSSDDHHLKLDWDGGFNYENTNIDLLSGKDIGVADLFTFNKASLTNITINNKDGLKSLGLKFDMIKIGPEGMLTIETVSGSWDKDKGFDFDIETHLKIQENTITGKLEFGLTKEGKFRKGAFSIENDKEVELIPGRLKALLSKASLTVSEDKKISGNVTASADLSTDYVKLDTGDVTIAYEEGWSFVAEDLNGQIFLPGSKDTPINIKAGVNYNKGDFEGNFGIDYKKDIEIVPGILTLGELGATGHYSSKTGDWGISLTGQTKLTSDYVNLNSGKATFIYEKATGWTLNVPELMGNIQLPGEKSIDLVAKFEIKNNKITGKFTSTTDALEDIVPGILGVKGLTVSGDINQAEKRWSLTVKGQADLTTEYVEFNSGEVIFNYVSKDSKGEWNLIADNLAGQILLPGDKSIDLTAGLEIKNKAITGKFTSTTDALEDIVPGILGVKGLTVSGDINQAEKRWSLTVKGQADLTTEYVEFNSGEVIFNYVSKDSKGEWNLIADNLAGQILLPGDKSIDLTAGLEIKNKAIAGKFTSETKALQDVVPGVFGIDKITVGGAFSQAEKNWNIDLGATAHLMIGDKEFIGEAALIFGNQGFTGSLNIKTISTFTIIPGILELTGAEFDGNLAIGNDKRIKLAAKIAASTQLTTKYFVLDVQNASVSYNPDAKTKAEAWTVDIESLSGTLLDRFYAKLEKTSFNLGAKKLEVDKFIVGLKHDGEGKAMESIDKDMGWADIAKVLRLVKDFQVEAIYNKINLGNDESPFQGKMPDSWSFKKLEMEYMGFGASLSFLDGNISGSLKAGYSTEINILNLEGDFPIPGAPGLNVTAGLNIVAPLKLSADVGMTYDGERSKPSDQKYLFKVNGNVLIDGGIYMEGVVGASLGAGSLASIGGQLFGRLGVKSSVDAGATAGFMYDGKKDGLKNKFSVGPEPKDKFAFNVNAQFRPSLQLGGRLVAKLLGKKFNLLQYKFVDWDFGSSAQLVFDIALNRDGVYQLQIDEKSSKIGNESFEDKFSLKKLMGESLGEMDYSVLDDYEDLRDTFSDTERSKDKKDWGKYEENRRKLDKNVVGVEYSLIELLANLEIKKNELQKAFTIQRQKESDATSAYRLKRLFRHYESEDIEEKLKDAENVIRKLEHEIPKVMLLNHNSVAAVDLLQKRRDAWWHAFSHKRFGIWDDLYEEVVKDRIERQTGQTIDEDMLDEEVIEKEAKLFREQLQAEIKVRTDSMIRKIKENQTDDARGDRTPDGK